VTQRPEPPRPERRRRSLIARVLGALGPGVITGAADDDPSGIATYSIAGAQLGSRLAWTAIFTWPLMGAVQMMCARIGMVTGQGLAQALRAKLPRPVLVLLVIGLLVANTINVGADLAGMADAAEMFTGVDSHWLVVLLALLIGWATIRLPYHVIARTLKWLAAALFAYVVTMVRVKPDWHRVLTDLFLPSWPSSSAEWATLVAILGTTISPYLFFWQSSQEVEEERAKGRATIESRIGASRGELRRRRLDVGVGTFFSNFVMFAIIVTTASTLHRAGQTTIATSRQAAEALVPLAGSMAAALYTIGLLGVGFLAIPTLTGSAAYALSEVFGWEGGLDRKWREAPGFYAVVVVATFGGIAMDFVNVPPLSTLFWSAVINGILAPFMLLGILLVASDKTIMHGQPSSRLSRIMVTIATVLMFGAAVGLML
jgi:NRAMP (natural resistance-associated macrophage protein)-like metal ion transporter